MILYEADVILGKARIAILRVDQWGNVEVHNTSESYLGQLRLAVNVIGARWLGTALNGDKIRDFAADIANYMAINMEVSQWDA